jgi:hypothetical protein
MVFVEQISGGGLLGERPKTQIGVWGVFVLGANRAFTVVGEIAIFSPTT